MKTKITGEWLADKLCSLDNGFASWRSLRVTEQAAFEALALAVRTELLGTFETIDDFVDLLDAVYNTGHGQRIPQHELLAHSGLNHDDISRIIESGPVQLTAQYQAVGPMQRMMPGAQPLSNGVILLIKEHPGIYVLEFEHAG